jgi:hypothetical protein
MGNRQKGAKPIDKAPSMAGQGVAAAAQPEWGAVQAGQPKSRLLAETLFMDEECEECMRNESHSQSWTNGGYTSSGGGSQYGAAGGYTQYQTIQPAPLMTSTDQYASPALQPSQSGQPGMPQSLSQPAAGQTGMTNIPLSPFRPSPTSRGGRTSSAKRPTQTNQRMGSSSIYQTIPTGQSTVSSPIHMTAQPMTSDPGYGLTKTGFSASPGRSPASVKTRASPGKSKSNFNPAVASTSLHAQRPSLVGHNEDGKGKSILPDAPAMLAADKPQIEQTDEPYEEDYYGEQYEGEGEQAEEVVDDLEPSIEEVTAVGEGDIEPTDESGGVVEPAGDEVQPIIETEGVYDDAEQEDLGDPEEINQSTSGMMQEVPSISGYQSRAYPQQVAMDSAADSEMLTVGNLARAEIRPFLYEKQIVRGTFVVEHDYLPNMPDQGPIPLAAIADLVPFALRGQTGEQNEVVITGMNFADTAQGNESANHTGPLDFQVRNTSSIVDEDDTRTLTCSMPSVTTPGVSVPSHTCFCQVPGAQIPPTEIPPESMRPQSVSCTVPKNCSAAGRSLCKKCGQMTIRHSANSRRFK